MALSFWHILILLAAFWGLPWLTGKYVVHYAANWRAPLTRLPFVMRIVAIIAVLTLLQIPKDVPLAVWLAVIPGIWVLLPWFAVGRANDAGRLRACAVWAAVPVVGWICIIRLALAPSLRMAEVFE